jgi:flagellar hook protein FlgE
MTDFTLKFDANGKYQSGSGTGTLTLVNGSQTPMDVTLDFSALTQFAGSNTVKGNADGNAAGTLKSISIDNSGVITGTYTNGLKQSEAQVAIAQFTNASGLTKTGSSLYQESNNSGTPNVKTAADLGVTITPSALEMSNVDIANEFSDMIITQRGFQSNSKVITVGDEMLETLINMKR